MKGLVWRCAKLGAVLAAFVTAGFAFAIWHILPKSPIANGKPVGNLDVISLQLDILSLTISAIGIALAVMGLFGFHALKDAAEARAEKAASAIAAKKADEVATRAVAEHIEILEAKYRGDGLSTKPPETPETASVEDVIPEGDTEVKDGRNP